jgi:hypothetical protein
MTWWWPFSYLETLAGAMVLLVLIGLAALIRCTGADKEPYQ